MRSYSKGTRHITSKPGEPFAVELPAMGTAGYVWVVADTPGFVKLTDEGIRPAGKDIGASSVQRFVFVPERAGAGTLSLEYKQPWSADVEERLQIRIEAK